MAVKAKQVGTKVITGEGRLSFVHVFEPYAFNEGDEKKYSVRLLINKITGADTIKALEAAIEEAKKDGMKKKWAGEIPDDLELPIRDGDNPKIVKKYPEHAGHWFINVSTGLNNKKPEVIDRDKMPILDANELYSGCYGRISVVLFPFSVSGNDGISIGLNNVQKLRDGERLAGGTTAEDDFDDIDDEGGLLD